MISDIQDTWAARIRPQPMFDVLQRAQIQERTGQYVARMEIGDTPGFQNEEIHRLLAHFAQEPLRYSPSSGEVKLIEAAHLSQWANHSNTEMAVTIAPANFLITAAMASISSTGDVVYLPDPGFPSYVLAANFLGLRIVFYNSLTNFETSIREKIDETGLIPKLVMINNPSNPIGLAIDGKTFNGLSNYFDKNHIQLILDETYVNLVYDEINPSIDSHSAIRIRSFSKEHCAPGLRIGYALAPRKLAKVMSDLISLSISCSPKFIQLAVAEYLLSDFRATYTERVRNEMKNRFQVLRGIIPSEYFLVNSNSAFYALLRIQNDIEGFEFLMNENVSTCPGSKFGENSVNSIRISLAGKKESFENDINMLKNALDRYSNR